MSDLVIATAIVGIVAIVAITFGFVFRAKIGEKGVELDTEPAEQKKKAAKRRKKSA